MSTAPRAIHPYSAASPNLDDDTMDQLRDSIAQQGQLVPILVWRGEVLDGRKRLAACETLGIAPRIETLADDADGARVAIDANVLRTHYTPSQRAMFAASIATAKVGYRPDRDRKSGEEISSPDLVTEKEAAGLLQVDRDYVTQAKRIQRTAAPEITEHVRRGRLTLHAAKQIADRVPIDEQPRVADEVVAKKKGTRNTPLSIINAVSPGVKNAPRRDTSVALVRGVDSLSATSAALLPLAEESNLNGQQRADLSVALREVQRTVSAIGRAINKEGTYGKSA